MYHTYTGHNSYSENKQFIKISIDWKDQMFILLSFEKTYVKTKIPTKLCLGNHNAKARFETLKVQFF